MEQKRSVIFAAVIAVVFAVVFSTQFDSKLHLSGDNAVYLTLAHNIADGHGYAAPGTDGEYHPASHFPPGYSAILSVFMVVGIDSLVFFKVLNGLFLLASLLLLFYIVKGVTGHRELAFCSVLITVFSPQTLNFATIVMSEMSYMFFITLGFYFLYLYCNNPSYDGFGAPGGSKPHKELRSGPDISPEGDAENSRLSDGVKCFLKDPRFWMAIVSLAAAYHIRSVAMSAIGAAILFFLFRKEWKQALVFAGGILVLLVPWSVRNAMHGIESRYFGTVMTVNPWRPEQGNISSVGEMVEKMVNNFDETVIKGFREILFPFMEFGQGTPSGTFSVVCGLAVLALVLFGAWKMGRMRWMFLFYILGNIALFMLWHGGNGSRYVTPIAPVLFVCFYAGVYYLVSWIHGKISGKQPGMAVRWLPYAFLLMIVPAISPLKTYAAAASYPYPAAYENYLRIARELQSKTREIPDRTVVVARKPDLFNYFAGRLVAVNYKYTTDPGELVADLLNKNAEYVVLEQLGFSSTGLYLYPAIEAYPELFHVVWRLENPDTYLLMFDRERAARMLGGKTEPAGITESGD